jgi:hypothetical protein
MEYLYREIWQLLKPEHFSWEAALKFEEPVFHVYLQFGLN